MKTFFLTNPNWEKIAVEELKEQLKVSAISHDSVIEAELKSEQYISALAHLQLPRRIILSLGKYPHLDDLPLEKLDFPWKEVFSETLTFRVEIENVSGNDNRMALAKKVAGQLYKLLEAKLKIEPKIELKKPDFLVVVYFNGKEYFIGLDLLNLELNARPYRVFTGSVSFKGDYAYYLLKSSGYKKGEKLLVGYSKDGTLAIEAGMYNSGELVQNKAIILEKLQKINLFKKLDLKKILDHSREAAKEKLIFGFDSGITNVQAAIKNSQLAKVKDLVEISKLHLDDLDVRYPEGSFDRAIFQVTNKDEDQLNEIYYQTAYLLRKGGMLLLLGRKNWEVSVHSKFDLIKQEDLVRGDSVHRMWLLEKK